MVAGRLGRDIMIVLSIKLSIVLLAAIFVFGPRQRPSIDRDSIDRQILNNSDG
jgi:hypothetical protein